MHIIPIYFSFINKKRVNTYLYKDYCSVTKRKYRNANAFVINMTAFYIRNIELVNYLIPGIYGLYCLFWNVSLCSFVITLYIDLFFFSNHKKRAYFTAIVE